MDNYFKQAQAYKEGPDNDGEFGLHPNQPTYGSDNWVLWAATHLSLCTTEERIRESFWFKSTTDKCKIEPGLYHRHPPHISSDVNSHDNLLGLVIGAFYVKQTGIIEQVYDYGIRHLGCWNSENPGKWTVRSFLGRVPGVWAILKVATGRNLFWSPIDVLHAGLGYHINKAEAKDNTSGRCLLYLQSSLLYGKSWLLDKFIDSWRKKMNDLYPDGPRGLYTIFFGPDHIFTQVAPTRF